MIQIQISCFMLLLLFVLFCAHMAKQKNILNRFVIGWFYTTTPLILTLSAAKRLIGFRVPMRWFQYTYFVRFNVKTMAIAIKYLTYQCSFASERHDFVE